MITDRRSMRPLKSPVDKRSLTNKPYPPRIFNPCRPYERSLDQQNLYLSNSNYGQCQQSGAIFTIESADDDVENEDDVYFSSRHMAAARFQRNQRLLCDVFNEVCIPDLRSNITVDRIVQLRRQVDSLKSHRETFEKELQELEEKHLEKKRKFLESNEKFHNDYLEACSSTNISREKLNEMLQRFETMEKLQREKQQHPSLPPSSQIRIESHTHVQQTRVNNQYPVRMMPHNLFQQPHQYVSNQPIFYYQHHRPLSMFSPQQQYQFEQYHIQEQQQQVLAYRQAMMMANSQAQQQIAFPNDVCQPSTSAV
ncbi:unnamed protein product [Didymodactylos carnosus]|uniref:Uncharacterized protein n=1 Tax=Didymodactylos carnosus TaxID=1234261 RepID=A0A815K319_9BILA|nr:unnamed protein product [Didymodactylos carnosus]CAF1384463.1 unnamed protein product [Didymodactylos carnosus]CAF3649803.1 unnamed protein product [Didymodactylos carnosus]CAF4279663.1 unnamed protein product [Didymodactylos carnosus]